jgi:hypothetical protein
MKKGMKMGKTGSAIAIAAGVLGILAGSYAYTKRGRVRKAIKSDLFEFMGELKDNSAHIVHKKIGYPVYQYIKQKENIPY